MKLDAPDYERWIALSEASQHPNLFFLEPTADRITLYSQQVRALRLIHALLERERLAKGVRLAVIGAGAAGLSAAAAAALADVHVDLYERGTAILPLQSGSPRFLHPHIYEWPSHGALDPNAVLPLLDWTAGRGGDVRDALTASFTSMVYANSLSLRTHTNWTLESLERSDDEWLLKFKDERGTGQERTFDHVILAIGFGDEQQCGASPAVDYWRHPGQASDQVEMLRTRYFISGSGDGGLTDALAVLIYRFEHLEFTKKFLGRTKAGELAEVVLTAEAAVAAGGELRPAYEAHVLPVLKRRGLVDLVSEQLRDDRTLMFNAAVHLGKGKAARLNQVMMLALIEAAKHRDVLQFSSGAVTDVIKNGGLFEVTGPSHNGHASPPTFHCVILRHGPNRDKRFAPAGPAFTDYGVHHKKLLSADPNLGDPPRLHPRTFDYFDELIRARITDPGMRATRSAYAALRATTLLLTWDPAHQQVVQQGEEDFLDVVHRLDALPESRTLMLAASPDQLASYRDILRRTVRASTGKINLQVTGPYIASWKAVDSSLTGPPHFESPYHAEPMPSRKALVDALDMLLLRLLEQQLEYVVTSRLCAQLGSLHASIADTLLPTWKIWRSAIDADRHIRADFLRLLFQVELAGTSRWDGDHACLPHLVSALVLMLATDAGERLTPAKCAPGNVSFGADGVGLGSGCSLIYGRPIEDFGDPYGWSVDALFLSQARQEMFQTDDLITDGGTSPTSFSRAKRVAPAVIPNTRKWRGLLSGDLINWKAAVAEEFSNWRKRQLDSLEGV